MEIKAFSKISQIRSKTTSRGIPEFSKTFSRMFSFHSTLLQEYLELSVEWFAFGNSTVCGCYGNFSGKFLYHLQLFPSLHNRRFMFASIGSWSACYAGYCLQISEIFGWMESALCFWNNVTSRMIFCNNSFLFNVQCSVPQCMQYRIKLRSVLVLLSSVFFFLFITTLSGQIVYNQLNSA